MTSRPAPLAALAAAVLVLLAGCARWTDAPVDQPGANERLGNMLVRYVHIAEPPPGGPHPAGADVPMYAWLYNNGPQADRLVSVTATAAEEVGFSGGSLPAAVPAGGRLMLRPEEDHLVLRDTTRELRGGDYVDVTLRFERAGEVSLNVQVQPPPYDDGRWAPVPLPG